MRRPCYFVEPNALNRTGLGRRQDHGLRLQAHRGSRELAEIVHARSMRVFHKSKIVRRWLVLLKDWKVVTRRAADFRWNCVPRIL